ncbi:MAG: helix-turn-helix domain-containing protein [Acidobacteriota bacterium]|nr:helix-turn-helix domain-containing protein [Acidobacteriota bacterium]
MKTDILKTFGERVKKLRLEKNWSQETLAEKTGFHRTYIGMVERGERNLSLKNIETFAITFEIKISELLEL